MLKVYQVFQKLDSKEDGEFDIPPQHAKCLAVMKKDEKTDSKAFAKEHKNEFTQRRNALEATLAVVYKVTSVGNSS